MENEKKEEGFRMKKKGDVKYMAFLILFHSLLAFQQNKKI